MIGEWLRFAASAACLGFGILFMVFAVLGVNRFQKALNRMHAAAMGDTMGISLVMLGLILIKGFSMDSLKLFLVVLFFWVASPVSSHMISWLEAMTDEHLGEIRVIRKTGGAQTGEIMQKAGEKQEDEEKQKTEEAQSGKGDGAR